MMSFLLANPFSKMWFFIAFTFVLLINILIVSSEVAVFCYYGTWATYRHGNGKYDVEHVDPHLCTHLVYTFAGIDDHGNVISLDPWLDLPDNWGRDNFRKFNALKQKNSSLKTLLAVGGWNEGSAKYSTMASNPALRKNFIESAIKMLTDYKFDGLDLDWEYPNRRDTIYGQADIDNYTKLLRELKEAFDKYNYMLTAAVASVKEMASLSYDIPAISQYLDIINIMTYDMAGPWDTVTGHNSPLHKGEGFNDNVVMENIFTVDQALRYWIDAGCPPEKIAMSVPFYGHTFTLRNSNVNGVGAPSNGVGLAGLYTAMNGVVGYNEFCYKLLTEQWTKRFDTLAKVPYAFKDTNWVSYDNALSIIMKIKYAKSLGINKVMIWSVETDDFRGLCGDGVNPLLRAVNKALVDEYDDEILLIEEQNGNDNAAPQVTTEAADNFVCQQEGFAANPQDCSSFYRCVKDSSGSLVPYRFQCPSDLYWDQRSLTCDYRYSVQCDVA